MFHSKLWLESNGKEQHSKTEQVSSEADGSASNTLPGPTLSEEEEEEEARSPHASPWPQKQGCMHCSAFPALPVLRPYRCQEPAMRACCCVRFLSIWDLPVSTEGKAATGGISSAHSAEVVGCLGNSHGRDPTSLTVYVSMLY